MSGGGETGSGGDFSVWVARGLRPHERSVQGVAGAAVDALSHCPRLQGPSPSRAQHNFGLILFLGNQSKDCSDNLSQPADAN